MLSHLINLFKSVSSKAVMGGTKTRSLLVVLCFGGCCGSPFFNQELAFGIPPRVPIVSCFYRQGREKTKSCFVQVFNTRLACFASQRKMLSTPLQTLLELINRPRFHNLSWSLSKLFKSIGAMLRFLPGCFNKDPTVWLEWASQPLSTFIKIVWVWKTKIIDKLRPYIFYIHLTKK